MTDDHNALIEDYCDLAETLIEKSVIGILPEYELLLLESLCRTITVQSTLTRLMLEVAGRELEKGDEDDSDVEGTARPSP